MFFKIYLFRLGSNLRLDRLCSNAVDQIIQSLKVSFVGHFDALHLMFSE